MPLILEYPGIWLPQMDGLFHRKSCSKYGNFGGSPILGHLHKDLFSMGISGSSNGATVPYFWPYFVGIFPYISLI